MRRKDPNELNKREKAILKYIEEQVDQNGYPPSVREIGKAVDLSSTATVHGYLSSLEKKGYIKKHFVLQEILITSTTRHPEASGKSIHLRGMPSRASLTKCPEREPGQAIPLSLFMNLNL